MSKKINCVEIKHKAAEKIAKSISKLDFNNELKYWKEQTDELIQHKKEITKKLKSRKDKKRISKKIRDNNIL